MRILIASVLALSLMACGQQPEPNVSAEQTAIANKYHQGEGAPVASADFYKQSEEWKDAYYMYYDQLK